MAREDVPILALAALLSIVVAVPVALGYGLPMLAAVGAAVVVFRVATIGAWLPTVTVLLAPTLLGLGQLYGEDRAGLAYGAAAALLLLVAVAAYGRRVVPMQRYAPAVGLFLALLLVACLRTQEWGFLVVWASFFAFAAVVFLTADDSEVGRLKVAVILSPAIFVVANVLISLAGITSAREFMYPGAAEVLGAIGIAADRQLFPLANGYADFGTPAALGLVGTLMLLPGARKPIERVGLVVLAAFCLYGLLAVDSRAAIAAAVVAMALALVVAPRVGRAFGWIALLIPVTALVATLAVGAVAGSQEALQLSRSDSDPSTLTGRTFLWEKVTDRLDDVRADDLVGFGAYGTAEDGISDEYYVDLPLTVVDASQGSAHNFAFQTIFDIGYIGLAAVVLIFGFTLARLAGDWRDRTSAAMLAMLLLLMVVGATETTPSIYTTQAFAVFIGIVLLCLRRPRRDALPADRP